MTYAGQYDKLKKEAQEHLSLAEVHSGSDLITCAFHLDLTINLLTDARELLSEVSLKAFERVVK